MVDYFLYKKENRIFKLANHQKKGTTVERRKVEGMNQCRLSEGGCVERV
jgi:hypothetical protein